MRRWPLILLAAVVACGRGEPAPVASSADSPPPTSSQSAPAEPPAAAAPAPPEPVDIAAALADPNRVLLGVMRTDNVLIPIAVYSKGRWGGPDDEQMAVGVEGEPVPSTSRAWFLSNQTLPMQWFGSVAPGGAIALTSATPVPIDNHCQLNWALGVEGPPSTRKPHEHHTNLGIATTSDRDLRAVDVRPNDGDDARQTSKRLRPLLDSAEDDYQPSWPATDVPASVRKATLAKLRWLGRILLDGKTLWYTEVIKDYPNVPDTCGRRSVLRAWCVEDARGGLTPLSHDFLRTDSCDAKDDMHVWMLGALTIGGHRFVVTTEHGWEDEHYVIYEFTPTGLVPVLTVTGGGC